MSDEKKRDARSLVSSILSKNIGAPTLPDEKSDEEAQDEAVSLIDVYFELEDPHERDVAFDKLAALHAPVVDNFFRAMMEADEDEYVRAAAAAELARRGVAEAVELLHSDLRDPQEPFFFTNALMVLSDVLGPPFFETLLSIWRDETRDAEQRREAMVGLEVLDPARAVGEFVQFVEAQVDINLLPDDQLEVAMMAFARQAHVAAQRPLHALRERIAAAELDPDEKDELLGFVQEGLDLLGET